MWGALVSTGVKAFGKAAAKKAVAGAAKKAAGGALKKKAIGAAKGMAKEKAIDAVTGRGKKKGGELAKVAGGGGLQRKQSAVVKPTIRLVEGGGDDSGGGGAIVSKPSEGGKISFGGINKQIDSIVGITGALKTTFEQQTENKVNQQKALRKQLEKQKKAAREELLESKPVDDPGVKQEKGPKKKVGFLGMIWNFLKNILLGTLVVSFLKLAALAKNIFGRASAAMEALFWGIRSLFLFPKTLMGAIKGLRDLLKVGSDAILKPFKALGNSIKNGFKTAGNKIFSFVKDTALKAINWAKDVGAKAAQWAKNVAGRGAKWVKGGFDVLRKTRVGKTVEGAVKGVRSGVDALRKTKAGKAVEGAVKGVRRVGGNLVKGAGGLLRRGGNLLKGTGNLLRGGNRAIGGGASRLAKGAISTVTAPIKAVSGGIKAIGGFASKVKGGLKSGAQWAGKTAGKVAGKVGGFATKLFPGLGKLIAKGAPIFKGMAKAAKGIKIPVVGPIMVAVSSLLAGEPLGQVGFKTMGAGIGGALGTMIPIPILGTIFGEMAGEFVGDLAYSLFMGGGMEEVKAKAAKKMQDMMKAGTSVKDFVVGGFSRFWKNFTEEHQIPIPKGKGLQTLLGKVLPGLANDKGLVTGIPNILQLLNPFATFPLLKKSFFPPKGEESSGGLKPAEVAAGGGEKASKDADLVSTEADYETGGGDTIIMDSSGGDGGSSGGFSSGGGGQSGGSSVVVVPADPSAAANALNKQETLGVLYQS